MVKKCVIRITEFEFLYQQNCPNSIEYQTYALLYDIVLMAKAQNYQTMHFNQRIRIIYVYVYI